MKYWHRMLRLSLLILVTTVLTQHTVAGQDAHFSQFYASPLTLNPAMAGTAAGTYRVTANYRDQWRGALDNPLKTFSFAGDLNFPLGDAKNNPDYVGAGFMFYSDRVDAFDLNTNQIAIVGSYHKSLDQRQTKYLGAGLQFGISQKGINYEDLTFQDEFNAIDGFTLPTGELLPQNNLAYLDFAVGLSYHSSNSNTKNKTHLGISYAHFNGPNVSFYRSTANPAPGLQIESVLLPKLTAHAAFSFRSGQKMDIQPRLVALVQGPHTEVTVGNNFKFALNDRGTKYLHMGPYVRTVNNIDGYGIESIVGAVGFELEGMIIGLSYDYNLSDLITDRSGLNALEFSITFIGEHENEDNFCPTF